MYYDNRIQFTNYLDDRIILHCFHLNPNIYYCSILPKHMPKLARVKEFHEELFSWWADNKRDLPWRETTNPYYIMISEFQLQQTQVSRVIPKYLEFVEKYPTLQDLATADKSEVITLWQGLGYNRRAVWLQEAAETLVDLDEFPREPKELQKIKGIGPYTSRSIPIFAFNEDLATVDTNIRRIYLHKGYITKEMSKTQIQEIANKIYPKGRSRDYHNALMDYGSLKITASRTGIKSRDNQSTFQNSTRQIRGNIISILVDEPNLDTEELSQKLPQNIEMNKLDKILQKLVKDGMISADGNIFALPK